MAMSSATLVSPSFSTAFKQLRERQGKSTDNTTGLAEESDDDPSSIFEDYPVCNSRVWNEEMCSFKSISTYNKNMKQFSEFLSNTVTPIKKESVCNDLSGSSVRSPVSFIDLSGDSSARRSFVSSNKKHPINTSGNNNDF